MGATEDRVNAIIVDVLAVDPEEVVATANFADDLGADDIDIMEVVAGLGREFLFSPSEVDNGQVHLVQDAYDLVSFYLRAKGG